jgi:hypothetical protein
MKGSTSGPLMRLTNKHPPRHSLGQNVLVAARILCGSISGLLRLLVRSNADAGDDIEAEEAKLNDEENAISRSKMSAVERELKMYEINERRRELKERRAAQGKSRESSSGSSRKRKREMTKDEALKDLLVRSTAGIAVC